MIVSDGVHAPSMPAPHPWRLLRDLPIDVHHVELPDGLRGVTDGRTIWLHKRLTQRDRRCVVLHEAIHIARNEGTRQDERTEEQVWAATARWLLPDIKVVGEALAWAHDIEEAAEELWVCRRTLEARLRHAHPVEKAYLRRRLEEDDDHA